ncbi:hypothetical protein IAT38_004675 [Cryptococcus sp. DSM 104549]
MAHFLAPSPLPSTPSSSFQPSPASSTHSPSLSDESLPASPSSEHNQEHDYLSPPISVTGRRSAQPRSTSRGSSRGGSTRGGSGSRSRRRLPDGVGGELVGSMKRGLKTESGVGRGQRLRVLFGIALLLFVILTTVWAVRLNGRVQSLGGWGVVLERWLPITRESASKREL